MGAEAAQTVSYGYNPTSMLQGEGASQGGASTPALSKSYGFDAMGNRTGFSDAVAKTQVTSTYNNLNQLTSTNSFSTSSGQAVATGSNAFGYDGDGNMALITAKDAAGTVTSQATYSYDDASRLIGIETPNSSKWQFVYDGMSRLRISRSWNWINGAWVQNSEVHRVYLGMEVVQERDANNVVTASYSGRRLARSTSTGNVFYGYDGNGSVTSLTDSTGAIVGSYTYDAWGNMIASSGAKAQENPYRYSGKEQLAGYTFYGYRFYSSGLGRWINRDPLREEGGTNLYVFVNSNPLNMKDEEGLDVMGVEMPSWPNPFPAVEQGIIILGEGVVVIITSPVTIMFGATLILQGSTATPAQDDWRPPLYCPAIPKKGKPVAPSSLKPLRDILLGNGVTGREIQELPGKVRDELDDWEIDPSKFRQEVDEIIDNYRKGGMSEADLNKLKKIFTDKDLPNRTRGD